MAKKKSKKKKSKKKSKSKKEKSVIKEKSEKVKKVISDHLNKEFKVPATIALVVLIVLVFTLVKLPYEVRESYTEIVTEQVTETEIVEDRDNPVEIEKCQKGPAELDITNHYVYTEPYGNYDYFCVAEFRVRNQEKEEGEWTFEYRFDISGKEVVTDPITKKISGYTTTTFEFRSDECQEKDQDLEGEYTILSEPIVEECTYVQVYPNVTKEVTREVEKEVPKERIVTKYETLWARIFGLNKAEKV